MKKETGTPQGAVGERPMADLIKELDVVLVGRLEQIEAGQRRIRSLAAVLGVMVLAVVGATGFLFWGLARAGYLGAGAPSVTAQRFVLTDGAGAERAVLSTLDDGSVRLALNGTDGVARVKLTVLENGAPGLTLADASGRPRVVLGLLPDETSTLVFADRDGQTRAVLGLSMDEAANLVFADRSGITRIGFGVAGTGGATVTLPEEMLSPAEPGASTGSD